jgi:hypothetical protein
MGISKEQLQSIVSATSTKSGGLTPVQLVVLGGLDFLEEAKAASEAVTEYSTGVAYEFIDQRHLKQANGDPAPKDPKPDKKKAKTDPVHTHPIDQKPAEPCETCEKYGEPLAPPPTEFEKVVTPKTAAERLAEMLAEADQGDSDQETDSGDLVEAEEFEEDE